MSDDWLFDKIQRVPKISNKQIAAMRHIEPVLQDEETRMYQRIKGIEEIDPRNVSFLWDAQPTGPLFTFQTLNIARIITQHKSSVFFKPSLAEVYAWILVYMPETWEQVTCFHISNVERISRSSDCVCQCDVMGGPMLKRGKESRSLSGAVTGWTLEPVE